MLSVLDPEPPVPGGIFTLHLLEDVQHDVIGPVSDGMNDDLETSGIGRRHHLFHVSLGKHHGCRQPAGRRGVRVRREEQGRRGSERAVGESLDSADAKPGGAESGAQACIFESFMLGERIAAVDAQGQFAGLLKRLISLNLQNGGQILDTGDSHPPGLRKAGEDRTAQDFRRGRRNETV